MILRTLDPLGDLEEDFILTHAWYGGLADVGRRVRTKELTVDIMVATESDDLLRALVYQLGVGRREVVDAVHTTSRSSSDRMAWSTCQAVRRCGNTTEPMMNYGCDSGASRGIREEVVAVTNERCSSGSRGGQMRKSSGRGTIG